MQHGNNINSSIFYIFVTGDLVESQTIPIPESVLELAKAHRDSKFTQELTFFAQVPAIGAANFKVSRTNVSPSNHFSALTEHKNGQDSNIQVGVIFS